MPNTSQHKQSKQDKKTKQDKKAKPETSPNAGAIEGEGSYTAARRYNDGVAETVQRGNTEELGKEAKDALEGPEGDSLRRAEKIGKHGGVE